MARSCPPYILVAARVQCFDLLGPLAVTRSLADGRHCAITHVPTGQTLGSLLFTVDGARSAIRAVRRLIDWNEVTISGFYALDNERKRKVVDTLKRFAIVEVSE